MWVAKFSERDTSYNHVSYHGKYMAIDQNSGGYPYNVDSLAGAHIFNSLDDAQVYLRGFSHLDLYKLEYTLKKVEE